VNPASFEPIPPDHEREIVDSLNDEAFHRWMGIRFEEIRSGYARLRLRYQRQLNQGDGVVHGGAIATAVDTVVIGAILSTLRERPRRLATIDLHVQYLDRVADEDIIAEARVRRRGKTVVFVEVDARSANGREVAHGEVSCRVSA
jgi:acyl-CoA thioesterase